MVEAVREDQRWERGTATCESGTREARWEEGQDSHEARTICVQDRAKGEEPVTDEAGSGWRDMQCYADKRRV